MRSSLLRKMREKVEQIQPSFVMETRDERTNTPTVQMKPPLNPQQVRQREIAFDVSRKFAPANPCLQCLLVEAVDWAFILDNAERETMEVCQTTDEEYVETKLGLRDGTIKLDTSWIE